MRILGFWIVLCLPPCTGTVHDVLRSHRPDVRTVRTTEGCSTHNATEPVDFRTRSELTASGVRIRRQPVHEMQDIPRLKHKYFTENRLEHLRHK